MLSAAVPPLEIAFWTRARYQVPLGPALCAGVDGCSVGRWRGSRLVNVAGGEGGGELLAGGDGELLVGVGEVPFDGSGGDEEVLGDVAVGETGGGELGDATLARG